MEVPSASVNYSIFMCKLCNLFSPNQSELLSHVLEKHAEEELRADEIVIPLRPLLTSTSTNKSTEDFVGVKRKRGRPKGSTKKLYPDEDAAENIVIDAAEGNPLETEKEERLLDTLPVSLECRKCTRKFSNSRQLRKHICMHFPNEESVEHEDHCNESDAEFENSSKEDEKERTSKKLRMQRTEKVSSTRESDQIPGAKKPIISVVLTAHEAIPGATKIVPVEAPPPDAEPTDMEPTEQDNVQRRGYQEYAIQQTPYEQPMNPHRSASTQLKIFTCESCNKVFKFKHSLEAHLRIHTNEKPFKCPHCTYASAIKANLNVHMRKHTGEKFGCDYCSFTCLSKGHLKVHVERVHKKIKQHCRFCNKKYSDVKNLIRHIKESHDLQDQKVKDAYDALCLMTREGKRQLLYDCNICERKFKNELDRDRHMLVHGDVRPFACELCGYGATKFQALDLHVRKHPFVYVCSVCLKKFVSSVRLRTHIRESHSTHGETTVFTDSINHSFCLLEPGGDVQQEALREVGSQTTAELAILNSNVPLILEELPPEEDIVSGMHNYHNSLSEIEVICSVKSPTNETENESVTKLLPTESDKLNSSSQVSSMNLVASISDDCENQKYSAEQTYSSNVSLTVKFQGIFQPSVAQTMDATQDLKLSDDLSITGVFKGTSPLKESEANAASHQKILELGDTARTAGGDMYPNVQMPSHNIGRENQQESAAFMQIVDGLLKREMNMDLFERLRKVYGDHECAYCGKLFWYQVHYDMHVRTHTREHLYYCSQCTYSSITKNCLNRHVIQKHSNVLLKCPTEGCDYTTPDKYKLQTHIKGHSDLDKSYSCPICEKSFSDDRLIRSHIKANHPEVASSTISEIIGKRVQLKGLIGKRAAKCPYCDFYFVKNGSDLQRHIWAHEGLKPFKCSVCDYATRSKSNLKAHMNRHCSEKTHLCDMCGKKFKSKGSLKSHKLLHVVDGKQFKCTVCDFTAAHKPQLVRHMEQHAPFKPFRCAQCHYSCNIAGSLKRHYNKKHPNEECVNAEAEVLSVENIIQQGGLKCLICSFVYGTKWEFSRHLKNKHGLKLLENETFKNWEQSLETTEGSSTQYLHITDTEEDVRGTRAAVAALQDLRYTSDNGDRPDPTTVNILQQIIDLGTEPQDAAAVASVVSMAPGTVTLVGQATEDDQADSHRMMIQEALQQASMGFGDPHHLVVSSEEVEGIETVTVFTQGEETSEFIVYVQEAMPSLDVQTVEQAVEET
ncbi:zinc finger protein ZFAT isoform X1 [Pleurodeles waltl]|uniref:zinc finger protein ZFAT isoform X1 n=2 Tax=Pleurodeles waltl TaxID=8319 RepID=UPI003709ACC9